MGDNGHGINVILRIIHHNHAGRIAEDLPDLFRFKLFFEFNIYRFGMTPDNRNSHRGCGHPDGIILHDLPGFVHHLHFFLGVTVVQEYINMRKRIHVDFVRISHFARNAFPLVHQLVHCFLPRPGDRLVRRNHDTFHLVGFMKACQRNHHLNRRAVRIGNDFIGFCQDMGIHFRNHKLYTRFHSPCRGIVHHRSTGLCKFRRPRF